MPPYRIIHFVCGGADSGSTGIAISLAKGHQQGTLLQPSLIFRGKIPESLATELTEKNIAWFEVPWNPKITIIKQLIHIIKNFKPEIFVAHGYREHIFGRIAAVIAKVPIIIQVEHNTEKYEPHRYLESLILSFFTQKIICVSAGVRNYLIHLGFNPKKLIAINNGIEIESFQAAAKKALKERNPNIIMCARFCRQKDQPTLIRAFKLLQQWHKNSELIFLGAGQEKYKVKAQKICSLLDLNEQVIFRGQVAKSEVINYLANNQIFVLSTHYEGFGLVVAEAMVAGCVVIATDVVGVRELIQDGKTGFLVPKKNPKALAAKINYILNNRESAEKIALEGQKYAQENFSVQKMLQQYEEVFLNLVNNMKPFKPNH